MSDYVLVRRDGHLVEIVLNRPDKRNAINWSMMQALEAAIDSVEGIRDARAVILRGEGPGFCAGIDLMGFGDIAAEFGEDWRENLFPVTAAYQRVVNKFERCALPVIALVHNFCLGLGLELALACDFRIVAGGTRLGLPESRLGIIPDVGGTTRLTRLVGPARAKELIMTGRTFDPDCAERWGIVNYVVPEDDLLARGHTLADELAEAAPLAVSYAKKVIDGLDDLERGLQLEAWAQSILMRSKDFEIGTQAMLTRQPPYWQGR
jgi:enoyl-CoA hydratase/carnithine racemase